MLGNTAYARVAELVDAPDLESGGFALRVQVPPFAPLRPFRTHDLRPGSGMIEISARFARLCAVRAPYKRSLLWNMLLKTSPR